MKIVIAVLYLVAAVLPTWGLGRLLFRTQSRLNLVEEQAIKRGHSRQGWVDLKKDLVLEAKEFRNDALWDTVLVGLGLLCGAVASIWSLFL